MGLLDWRDAEQRVKEYYERTRRSSLRITPHLTLEPGLDKTALITVAHVDDDESHLKLSKMILEKQDQLKITTFNDPLTALNGIQETAFDCILVDYKMPHMNGIELAKKIRENKDTPIIIYTGQGSEEIAEQAFHIGIDDYLRKEIDKGHYTVLEKRIEAVVENYRNKKSLIESERMHREYSRKLELLLEHYTRLNSATSITKVVEATYRILAGLYHFETGSLGFVHNDVLAHFSGWGNHPDTIHEMPLNGRGISVRAVTFGKTQYIPDVDEDPDYIFVEEFQLQRAKTELDVPILLGDQVIGVINIESADKDAFSLDDIKVVELIANRVSTVIEKIGSNSDSCNIDNLVENLRNQYNPVPVDWEKKSSVEEFQDVYQRKTRSAMDRYHDLLKAVYNGETVLNRILNRTLIPWKPGKSMVDDLVIKGHLTQEQTTASRYAYRITEMGIKALEAYEGIIKNL